MVAQKHLLLLVGSPRKKGTSGSFARTMQALAADQGWSSEIAFVYDYFDGRRSLEELQARIAGSDLVGLVAPLYYDTLPGAVVWLFEELWREGRSALAGKPFFAVAQSAYPFVQLMQPLIASCRLFAEATGMEWLGGLGYGGGVLIDGTPLEEYGRRGRIISEALRVALDEVLCGRPIPARAQELLVVRIPKILFRPLAAAMNWKIRRTARRLGAVDFERKVYL